MDSLQKYARVIQHDQRNWLIGGTWSAGGRFPKKVNMVKQTKEEQFPLDRSYSVWLKEEKQAAWFVFPSGKPPADEKGKRLKALIPLAWVVLQRMRVGQMPWRGLFRLMDDAWWFIAVDANGAVHPRWDILIPDAEKSRFFTEHRSEIASFPNEVVCDTPEESFSWLFGDDLPRSMPRVLPVLANRQQAKKVVLLGGLVVMLGGAGIYGAHLWHQHQIRIEQQRQRAIMAARAYALTHGLAMQSAARSAMIARVNAIWQSYPRPWQASVSWDKAIHACTSNLGGLDTVSDYGWKLSVLSCDFQGTEMTVHKTWVRTPLATVFHAPTGAIGKLGNTITSVKTVQMPVSHESGIPKKSDAEKEWMGLRQQWAGVLAITTSHMQSFVPKIPAFVPANDRKTMHPPILWRMNPVVIAAPFLPITPLWPVLKTHGFLPKSIEAHLMSRSILWTVTGIQYAH